MNYLTCSYSFESHESYYSYESHESYEPLNHMIHLKLGQASEVAAAKKNYDILVQDEMMKARTCKLCPHCNKIVWKLEGCDSMTCGRDAADKGIDYRAILVNCVYLIY